jgi:hypothetical protein
MTIVSDLKDRGGLCATCVHVRRVGSRRGSVFLLCERSNSDPRYARYPQLPVVHCPGYEGDTERGGGCAPGSDG